MLYIQRGEWVGGEIKQYIHTFVNVFAWGRKRERKRDTRYRLIASKSTSVYTKIHSLTIVHYHSSPSPTLLCTRTHTHTHTNTRTHKSYLSLTPASLFTLILYFFIFHKHSLSLPLIMSHSLFLSLISMLLFSIAGSLSYVLTSLSRRRRRQSHTASVLLQTVSVVTLQHMLGSLTLLPLKRSCWEEIHRSGCKVSRSSTWPIEIPMMNSSV